MQPLETRYLPATELRVVTGPDARPRIVGTAIVFDALSEDLGGFREQIIRDAVLGPLGSGADVRALVDHDTGKLLARTKAGTLRYQIDREGVQVEIDPPDTTYARDVLESIRRGDLDGMSFAFRVAEGGDVWALQGDMPVRTITAIERISEFSLVTFPAYPQTDAAVRSLEAAKEQIPPPPAAGLSVRAAEARLRIAESF